MTDFCWSRRRLRTVVAIGEEEKVTSDSSSGRTFIKIKQSDDYVLSRGSVYCSNGSFMFADFSIDVAQALHIPEYPVIKNLFIGKTLS